MEAAIYITATSEILLEMVGGHASYLNRETAVYGIAYLALLCLDKGCELLWSHNYTWRG